MTKSELKEIIKECMIEESVVSESEKFINETCDIVFLSEEIDCELLQELNASESQVKEFKEVLSIIKGIVNGYIEIIETCSDVLEDITKRAAGCKNRDQLNKLAYDVKKTYPEKTRAAYAKLYKSDAIQKNSGGRGWKRLYNITSRFRVKYSDTMMEEKKLIDKELEGLSKKLKEIGYNWCKVNGSGDWPKYDAYCGAIAKAYMIDTGIAGEIMRDAYGLYKILVSELRATSNDIAVTRSKLGLEKEDALVFKIVNKLFKSNK